VFVRDVSADVRDNDEAEVVVLADNGPLRVFESMVTGALVLNSYRVVLSRAPEENVLVTAAPVAIRESALAAGGKGVALNTEDNAAEASENGVSLLFRATIGSCRGRFKSAHRRMLWRKALTVSPSSTGHNKARARRMAALDRLAVLGLVATVVDDDSAAVLIAPFDNSGAAPRPLARSSPREAIRTAP
jgi:hypothetical protein